MFDPESPIGKARTFVQKHQTTVACTATALITWKLTKNATLRSVLNETTEMAYKWGNDNGVLEVQNLVLMAFVDEKGLKDEFLKEFIPSL